MRRLLLLGLIFTISNLTIAQKSKKLIIKINVSDRAQQDGISTNLEAIESDFTIWGYCKGDWELFSKGVDYDIFLVERKL
ncbi:DUF6934 family protein [Dyadobacter arcticus]|uniref:Uncharacterized protein n=1 Tax=Dyadobacter arcticus TaxID=1078754 RepID=A0ABX0UFF6_9BACT|nr:hypothetical protein [Dyadobacter arcticus]NIJ51253.1 hypothetical protein [Dyadobacter arcticus]